MDQNVGLFNKIRETHWSR